MESLSSPGRPAKMDPDLSDDHILSTSGLVQCKNGAIIADLLSCFLLASLPSLKRCFQGGCPKSRPAGRCHRKTLTTETRRRNAVSHRLSVTQASHSFTNMMVMSVSRCLLLLLPVDLLEPPAKVRIPSRAALTHRVRKMKSKMVKCKQCDNYIVVNGVECEEVRQNSKRLQGFPLLLRNTLNGSGMFVLICSDLKIIGLKCYTLNNNRFEGIFI